MRWFSSRKFQILRDTECVGRRERKPTETRPIHRVNTGYDITIGRLGKMVLEANIDVETHYIKLFQSGRLRDSFTSLLAFYITGFYNSLALNVIGIFLQAQTFPIFSS